MLSHLDLWFAVFQFFLYNYKTTSIWCKICCWFQICTWNFDILSRFGDMSICSLLYIFLISDPNTCPILMYDHVNRSLWPPLQEYEVILPLESLQGALKWQKCANICDFRHIFAVFRCLIGPLVMILLHILVEEVISFNLHGHTSKLDKY